MFPICNAPGRKQNVPGSTKTIQVARYEKNVVEYVAQSFTYQQVKASHERAGRLLQPLEVPSWKWDHITMDFICRLPKTLAGHDIIWVIVDRLT